MKHSDGRTNTVQKKRPLDTTRMRSKSQKGETKRVAPVMKTSQPKAKKKLQRVPVSLESATRDTIAETIAFVIKGQLTPITPTPLPIGKSTAKRLQKARECKSKKGIGEGVKKDAKLETKKTALKSSKTKTKKDLDTSIKQIIRKYAKKLNIKSDNSKSDREAKKNEKKKETTTKSKLSENVSRIRKHSLSMVVPSSIVKPRRKCVSIRQNCVDSKKQDKKNDKDEVLVKIKEEKIDEVPNCLVTIKTEPEIEKNTDEVPSIVTDIKKEPIVEPLKNAIHKEPSKEKMKAASNKLRLLKKKALMRKEKIEDRRRAKLLQFWNSPKRHRVASLNAIAKVHCLYENESKAAFEKMTENSIVKWEPQAITTKPKPVSYISDDDSDSESDEQPVKRILRNVPGLRAVGKHWDMHDSISSDNNSDFEMNRVPVQRKAVARVKKEIPPKSAASEKPKKVNIEKKIQQKRRKSKQQEVYMDLKDMVVKKRMASLNASAILAASYSTDKNKPVRSPDSSSYDSDSSAEEYFAAVEQIDLTKDTKEHLDIKQEDDRNLIEVHTTPNKKVAVILNQDTDVTITGVYVNSTTRSTHHEGYCSIAGMQYRISATSHTQTAATTVATETLIQSGSSSDNAPSDAQSCSSKSYTPLDALSNMQPPPGPGIHNAPPAGLPGMPCQPIPQMGSPPHRQHSSSSAFSSPHHGPSPYHPPGGKPSPGESPVGGYTHGYYQPAGPLISVSHGHGQLPTQQPPLPKSVPLSDASPSSVTSSVHPTQPPPAPSSNNGDSSDNEVIITSVTTATKEPPPHPPSASYRYTQYSPYHTYPCPPQYHYQTPTPAPPYAHHEICYPTAPPTGGYLRHAKYAPSPSATYHRYPYYSGPSSELYPPTSAPPAQPSQQMVTASPVSANGSYPAAPNGPPPPPAIMEPYPPPPAPPTMVDAYQPSPHYYQSTYSLPPTCYSHSPTRAIPYINPTYQHCPCPLNTCPKNGHTGPLTGESKRSNISKDSKPLPPVALALPLEPVSATGPPSPARGSAGMPSGGGMPPPVPSPAGANYQPPPVPAPKQESRSPQASECKVEKRKARVGKANVRNNMHNTMLLMCNPTQDYVKREIESPQEKESCPLECLEKRDESSKVSEACTRDQSESTPTGEPVVSGCFPVIVQTKEQPMEAMAVSETAPSQTNESLSLPSPKEESLPPCIATVAENVKVKNMKRKQSQSKDKVPEEITPPPAKKKKLSSYKNFIKKHTSCFKISNGKKKLVNTELPKIKIKTPTKKKMNVSKEQTNNQRMKDKKQLLAKKSAPKLLDSLIAKNSISKVINDVMGKNPVVKQETEAKKAASKIARSPSRINNVKTSTSRRKSTSKCKSEVDPEHKTMKKSSVVPKWSNGWMWEGEPYDSKVFINSDETTLRKCYPSMRHKEGDLIRPGDCVLLKAGPRKNDLPYVAKIVALWENPEDGEMMMSLLWYYRPEHTEQGRLLTDQPDEVFASRHKDSNSVACIDDKCYVLTFNEYCRYKKNFKRIEECLDERPRCVPLPDPYPRIRKQPPSSNLSPDMVFFCRKVYDFRQKRIIKNPT